MVETRNTRLNSWKEIAAYLRVDVRTAQRWACSRGLPVHRIPGAGRRAVFGSVREIEAWLQSDKLSNLDGASLSGGSAEDAGLDYSQSADTTARDDGECEVLGSGSPIKSRYFSGKTLAIALSGVAAIIGLVTLVRAREITKIDSVSPIYAAKGQTIIIRGHGFGPRPHTLHMDSEGGVNTLAGSYLTSLAIINAGSGANHWVAGRAGETNVCEISVRLESWTDSQIVISGFSGPVGHGCGEKYQIKAGDPIEVGVFGPWNQCGPGGIANCPEEINRGRIGTFRTVVLDSPNPEPPCSVSAGLVAVSETSSQH
jgi:Helix-turn-helix domain